MFVLALLSIKPTASLAAYTRPLTPEDKTPGATNVTLINQANSAMTVQNANAVSAAKPVTNIGAAPLKQAEAAPESSPGQDSSSKQ